MAYKKISVLLLQACLWKIYLVLLKFFFGGRRPRKTAAGTLLTQFVIVPLLPHAPAVKLQLLIK